MHQKKSINNQRCLTNITSFFITNYVSIFVGSFVCLMLHDMYFNRGSFLSLFFMPYEPPATPDGSIPVPILGQHYFGDFQLPWIMAKGNPFVIDNPLNNILPLGYVPYLLLSGLNLNVAFAVYCIVALLIYVLVVNAFCRFGEISMKDATPFMLFNIPLLHSLDRGAIVLVVVSIFTFCILKILNPFKAVLSNHFVYLLIAYCISAKIYLLVSFILLIIGGLVRIKISLLILMYTILGNLATSYLFDGPISAIRQIIFSLTGATGEDLSNVLSNDSVNFASNFAKVTFRLGFKTDLIHLGVALISIASLLVAIMIVRKYKDTGVTILISLSMVQFFATVSYRYTTIWAVFAFLLVYKSRYFSNFKVANLVNLQYIKFSLVISLLPLPAPFLAIIPTLWLIIITRLLFSTEAASIALKGENTFRAKNIRGK